MLGAINPGQPGGDVTMMLEKVWVPPSVLAEIMGLAKLPALRAGEFPSPLTGQLKTKLVGLFAGVQVLANYPPGRLYAKPQGENVAAGHGESLLGGAVSDQMTTGYLKISKSTQNVEGARNSRLPRQVMKLPVQPIWFSATSRPAVPMSCGSPI